MAPAVRLWKLVAPDLLGQVQRTPAETSTVKMWGRQPSPPTLTGEYVSPGGPGRLGAGATSMVAVPTPLRSAVQPAPPSGSVLISSPALPLHDPQNKVRCAAPSAQAIPPPSFPAGQPTVRPTVSLSEPTFAAEHSPNFEGHLEVPQGLLRPRRSRGQARAGYYVR